MHQPILSKQTIFNIKNYLKYDHLFIEHNTMKAIETTRLILRTWEGKDIDVYFKINQDPKVLKFLPKTMTIEEVKSFMTAMNEQFQKHKYTLWAAEEKANGNLMGFIGLHRTNWESHFTPCIEIAWRLGSEHWNKGYATEGAKAALEYAFNQLCIKRIVAFTVPKNLRSTNVMKKIGMERVLDGDFSHPQLTKKHRLSHHLLYAIDNQTNSSSPKNN